jgi:hypothetical protein
MQKAIDHELCHEVITQKMAYVLLAASSRAFSEFMRDYMALGRANPVEIS